MVICMFLVVLHYEMMVLMGNSKVFNGSLHVFNDSVSISNGNGSILLSNQWFSMAIWSFAILLYYEIMVSTSICIVNDGFGSLWSHFNRF